MKNRNTEKKFIIFGTRPVLEALQSGKEIERLYFQQHTKGEMLEEVRKTAADNKVPYRIVPAEKLNSLTGHRNHQGVAAFLSHLQYQDIQNILPLVFEKGKIPLVLVLDRITDVRNFGAIARTAECAGVDAIIIPSHGGAQVTADAVKTSAGALHRVAVCREESLERTLRFLKDSGLHIVACTEHSQKSYTGSDLAVPAAILLGSEEDGISEKLLRLSDEKVRIPLAGEIRSLNVSVAAGIILYEAIRQRA